MKILDYQNAGSKHRIKTKTENNYWKQSEPNDYISVDVMNKRSNENIETALSPVQELFNGKGIELFVHSLAFDINIIDG